MYPVSVLEQIVALAREFELFLVADEIYIHMVYPGEDTAHLQKWPATCRLVVMRGTRRSCRGRAPAAAGLRCSTSRDQNFSAYVDSIVAAKRLEVCSTSGPQLAVSRSSTIRATPATCRTRAHVRRAGSGGLRDAGVHTGDQSASCPGRLYDRALRAWGAERRESAAHRRPEFAELVQRQSKVAAPDWRFVYYLLGSTGICVVPLTGFYTPYPGFRFTLLETDDAKRTWIFRTLAEAVSEYLESGKAVA